MNKDDDEIERKAIEYMNKHHCAGVNIWITNDGIIHISPCKHGIGRVVL